jgi:hypothetical protein
MKPDSLLCYVRTGYTGSDCSKKTSEESLNYSPALLGLIITLFIIVCALAAGLLFMISQISAYKEDMAHCQVLQARRRAPTAWWCYAQSFGEQVVTTAVSNIQIGGKGSEG